MRAVAADMPKHHVAAADMQPQHAAQLVKHHLAVAQPTRQQFDPAQVTQRLNGRSAHRTLPLLAAAHRILRLPVAAHRMPRLLAAADHTHRLPAAADMQAAAKKSSR
jgi:hypothetical protein